MKEVKNEVVTAGTTTAVSTIEGITQSAFVQVLQTTLGVSDLAYGTKFDSDDLVTAKDLFLTDYDFVSYTENAGTPKERDVRFAVWRVVLDRGNGFEEGYTQGGIVLTKLADGIEKNNLRPQMEAFKIHVKCAWAKTGSNNNVLTVSILG